MQKLSMSHLMPNNSVESHNMQASPTGSLIGFAAAVAPHVKR